MPTCIQCTLFKPMHRIVNFFADAPSESGNLPIPSMEAHIEMEEIKRSWHTPVGVQYFSACGGGLYKLKEEGRLTEGQRER